MPQDLKAPRISNRPGDYLHLTLRHRTHHNLTPLSDPQKA
jgi:hypothetical protein